MSFECLSATLPKKRGLFSFASKLNTKQTSEFNDEDDDSKRDEDSQAQTPTSGTSSGTIRKESFNPDESGSQPDGIPDEGQADHSPNNIFSPEESPDLEFRILPSQAEPQSALFKSPQKLESFFGSMKSRNSHLSKASEFNEDFYERIEEFLDQEGLHIVLPADCDTSMNASRTAVRKLLIGRTLSENVIGMQKTGFEADFEDSPGLTNNIKASTLVIRRTSLGHASSNEIEEAHQTMLIKKSLFDSGLKDLNEIIEESETQTLSRRSSFILPQSRASRKNTRKMTFQNSEWDDSFSDIQRSGTRHSSTQASSNFLFRGDEQVKSLSKLSPDMKPTAFSLQRANFFSPQVGFKQLGNELSKKSPLAMLCKKPFPFDQSEILVSKKPFEITPFARGFPSKDAKTSSISDLSPQLKVNLNQNNKGF